MQTNFFMGLIKMLPFDKAKRRKTIYNEKIKLNAEFGKLAFGLKRENKKYKDECFKHWSMLKYSLTVENLKQIKKWGIQKHTLPEWLMYITEELGELSKAISEFIYRMDNSHEIFNEAIQVATLALKIAEMIEVQE